jgi:hypothetical protein
VSSPWTRLLGRQNFRGTFIDKGSVDMLKAMRVYIKALIAAVAAEG